MFQFKQFSIQQQRTAMKVGTDGVLLGAWVPLINNPYTVLDIGAGTGVISLMVAQRAPEAQIDAVEIDEAAYEECVDNFENSPWKDRVFCYHADLEEFADEFYEEEEEEYDLIVSNPPFYSENYSSGDAQRDQARFQEAMPFDLLIESAQALLSDNGILAVVIPHKEEENFIALCASVNLFPLKITRVKGTPTAEIKRSLLAFTRIDQQPLVDELVIELERHVYTDAYKALTHEFYLKM
ncbi:methyltransferase [Flavobacterium agricola]|uniref:tRNA1(Val) (adenine(37)-N6)-methyltransferase n=1 Tax=Flavobacterium agricola TaxID=2870839 RepID=A0ABY6LYD3_9FLAO|nr:methyltransferase [Flavobacterium agricola]UYW01301.1 methyltransferase [Flavobacterium agricola]